MPKSNPTTKDETQSSRKRDDKLDDRGTTSKKGKGRQLTLGRIVQDEVEYRKKDVLGMTSEQSEGRRLGGSVRGRDTDTDRNLQDRNGGNNSRSEKPTPTSRSSQELGRWACLICTL